VFHVDLEEAKRRIRKDLAGGMDLSNVPEDVLDQLYAHYERTIRDNELEREGFEVIV